MKLNKYIIKRLKESWPVSGRDGDTELFYGNPMPTEEDVELWIDEWYRDVYERGPPIWLVGKRWNDKKDKEV